MHRCRHASPSRRDVVAHRLHDAHDLADVGRLVAYGAHQRNFQCEAFSSDAENCSGKYLDVRILGLSLVDFVRWYEQQDICECLWLGAVGFP